MEKWHSRSSRSRSVDWRELPSSPTSFCVFPVRDPAFSSELMILLVFNHADKDKKGSSVLFADQNKLLLAGLNIRSDAKKGKPAGYGMPGGGLNPEWLENMECAAIRESGNETNIKVAGVRLIPIPGKKNKALIIHKRTGDLIRWVLYSDDQQISLTLRPWEKVLLNPLGFYLADIKWFESKTRELLIDIKNNLIANNICTEEGIASLGISINDMTRDELITLGVHPEEVDEIGGFALLPISLLRQMIADKRFYLNPEEDRENRLDPTSYVYKSHVERLLQGLDIMGVV